MQNLDPEAERKASERKASLGDRAVVIAGLLALVATGFFGAEPAADPAPTASAAAGTAR